MTSRVTRREGARLAKQPDHVWVIDFTRIGGVFRPLWVGAVVKSGSIGLIERFRRSLKEKYVSLLFLYRSPQALDVKLERYRRWFHRERLHQGHGRRTPDDVYFSRPEKTTQDVTAARCTSGSTMETRGSLFCAFATLRRPPPSRPSDRATEPELRSPTAEAPEFTRVRRV